MELNKDQVNKLSLMVPNTKESIQMMLKMVQEDSILKTIATFKGISKKILQLDKEHRKEKIIYIKGHGRKTI